MRVALTRYGIRALRAEPLVSERDRNFRLDAIDGRRYVLKFSNSAEQEQVVDFQNRALQHIAVTDPGLPVPAGLFASSIFLSAAAEAVVALGPGLTCSIVASARRSSILLHLSSVRDS